MDELNENKSVLDPAKYSEKSRKIIFGISMAVVLIFVGFIMFIFNPQTAQPAAIKTTSANATQAPVNNESSANPTAIPDSSIPTYTAGAYPTSEDDAAAQAQQKLIARSKAEASTLTKNPTDNDNLTAPIPDSFRLQTVASKGMIEYCTDNLKETKEQKQARMKPYFHTDNSDYKSPQSILFAVKKCSLGAVDTPTLNSDGKIVVNVGIAWGGQLDEKGSASTGYTQYSVIVDKDGIVSFHD